MAASPSTGGTLSVPVRVQLVGAETDDKLEIADEFVAKVVAVMRQSGVIR